MRKLMLTVFAMVALAAGVATAQQAAPAGANAAPAPADANAAVMSGHAHHTAQHQAGTVGTVGPHPNYGDIHHHMRHGRNGLHSCVKHCGNMAHTGKMDKKHEAGCVNHCHAHHKGSPHSDQNAAKGTSKIGR